MGGGSVGSDEWKRVSMLHTWLNACDLQLYESEGGGEGA